MWWLYKCIKFGVREPANSGSFLLITPLESPLLPAGEQGYSNLNQVVGEAQKLISYADPSRTEGGIF
jgi:hypothetical protein